MKSSIVYAAAGLGSVSLVGGVTYAVRSVLGLGGTTGLVFSQNALDSPRSIPEPETFLLLGAGLLGLALWRQRSTVARLLKLISRNGSRYTEPTIEASFVNDSVKVWSTSKGAFVLSSLEAIASAGLLGAFNKLVRMVSEALLSLSSALKVAPLGYAETRTVFYDRGYDTR